MGWPFCERSSLSYKLQTVTLFFFLEKMLTKEERLPHCQRCPVSAPRREVGLFMDETRGPPEATGEGDAAMHTLSDGTATLSKWIDESIRFRPYTTLAVAAVLGLALGRVWRH